jgi:hypothetical protein
MKFNFNCLVLEDGSNMKDPAPWAATLHADQLLDNWVPRRREVFHRFFSGGGSRTRLRRLGQTDARPSFANEAAPAEKITNAAKQASNNAPPLDPARRALAVHDLVYDGPNRDGFTF